MKHKFAHSIMLVLTAAALAGTTTASATGGYALDWSAVAGGGAASSDGGSYSLGGTIGQPDAGPALSGGTYSLTGGFWGGALEPSIPPEFVTISGNVGVAGVTLTTDDIVPLSTTSIAGGNYSLSVPYNWTGTVTPTKAGCTFTPPSTTHSLALTSDVDEEDYAATCSATTTLRSLGTQDGWVLESSETSGSGGSLDAAATQFYLGDDAANKQYRGILSFDTSPLPDTATITSVTLKIKKTGLVGADPFGSLGNIVVDIKNGSFSSNPVLQKTDFKALATKNYVAKFTNTPVSNWYSTTLGAGSFGYVNRTGTTQFRLRFATDDNNNLLGNYLKLGSGNAVTTSRPQLIITYIP